VDLTAGEAPDGGRTGRNLVALGSSQLVTWSMSLVWTLVVPRALGPAGMGVIVAAWAVTGILGIVLGLGLRNYLVREIVVDHTEAPRLLGTAIVLRLVLAPLYLAAAFAYGRLAGWDHEATIVLYLAAFATIFVQVAEPLQAGFQAIERMEYLAYGDVINKSAQGLVGAVIALLGFQAAGIMGCWTAMAGTVLVLDVIWIRRYLRIDLRTSTRRLIDMVKQSAAYWAFGVFFMAYLWIDAVLLSLLTTPEVVGWYGVPMKLFQTLMFLPVVVSTAWLPRLVRAFQESPAELRREARAPLELMLVVSLPICAATAIAAGPLIHVLYGAAYANAVPVLVVLGLCIPPMYVNIVINQMLVAAKRQVVWTWVMAGATVVNPLFNLALIPATQHRYGNGAIGAAFSLFLTEVLIVSVGFVVLGRGVIDRQVGTRFALTAVAAGVMCAVAYAARPLGPVLSLLLGGLAFVLLALRLRLVRPDEAALLRAGAARVFDRVPGLAGRFRPATAGPNAPTSGR
jgi:O-antigen/teichoic acid export membrane protein